MSPKLLDVEYHSLVVHVKTDTNMNSIVLQIDCEHSFFDWCWSLQFWFEEGMQKLRL